MLRRLLSSAGGYKPFNESLLSVLCCPITKKPLKYDAARNLLIVIDSAPEIAYPIVNGIPSLLPSAAIRSDVADDSLSKDH